MIWAVVAIVAAVLAFATFALVTIMRAKSSENAALAVARDQQSRAERAELQRDSLEHDLATERARSKALEDYADELDANPNADLAPDDVAGRLRRLLPHDAKAAPAGDPVRGSAEPAVPPHSAEDGGDGAGPDDLLRP